MHNVENSGGCDCSGNDLKIDEEKIKEAVAAFKGVKSRFEYVIPPQEKQAGAYTHTRC